MFSQACLSYSVYSEWDDQATVTIFRTIFSAVFALVIVKHVPKYFFSSGRINAI